MINEIYYLYPRLSKSGAEHLAETYIIQTVEELAEIWAVTSENTVFAPTGGNRIQNDALKRLRSGIVAVAQNYGYPNPVGKNSARSFDVECAVLLHKKLRLHPSEASHNEMWSFLGCILLPDVVRWRFNDSRDTMHYVGHQRGIRRHAFGRLWWRAYLSYNPNWDNPYILFDHLNEDDFVAVTERSSIAVRPSLFQAFCDSFVRHKQKYREINHRDLIRQASKRVYRLLSLIAVEVLTDVELKELTDSILSKTAETLIVKAE